MTSSKLSGLLPPDPDSDYMRIKKEDLADVLGLTLIAIFNGARD
jgi:hypothetical protein